MLGGLISPFSVSCRVASSLVLLKSRREVRHSQSTTPIDQRSARWSTACPSACSGAMYAYFPFTTPVRVSTTFDSAFAMPKSSSFTTPL